MRSPLQIHFVTIRKGLPIMQLNREKLMKYVEEHWLVPCDDGMFFSYMKGNVNVEKERQRLHREGKLPDPKSWRAVFLPDVSDSGAVLNGKERACFIRPNNDIGIAIPTPSTLPAELNGKFEIVTYHHDKGLVDCAHYVSRCLTAGGLPTNHPGVPGLVQELQTGKYKKISKTLGNKVTVQQGDRILATGIMQPGDIVTYFHQNGTGASGGYSHSAVYTGKDASGQHRISCHTLSRRDDSFDNAPWSIGDGTGFRFTLIHLAAAEQQDQPPPSHIAAHLNQWFRISNGGRTSFYKFFDDGHAERMQTAPTKNQVHASGASSGGYWFVSQPEVKVFWPKEGEVDRIHTGFFALPELVKEFKFLINDTMADAVAI